MRYCLVTDVATTTIIVITSKLLLHHPELREPDGAVAWKRVLANFHRFFGQVNTCDTHQWNECLRKRRPQSTIRVLPESAWNNPVHASSPLQGHSGRVRVDPTLQSNVKIHYGRTDYMRLQIHCRCRFTRWRNRGQPRATYFCFFTVVAPYRDDVDPGQPRLVPHKIK